MLAELVTINGEIIMRATHGHIERSFAHITVSVRILYVCNLTTKNSQPLDGDTAIWKRKVYQCVGNSPYISAQHTECADVLHYALDSHYNVVNHAVMTLISIDYMYTVSKSRATMNVCCSHRFWLSADGCASKGYCYARFRCDDRYIRWHPGQWCSFARLSSSVSSTHVFIHSDEEAINVSGNAKPFGSCGSLSFRSRVILFPEKLLRA